MVTRGVSQWATAQFQSCEMPASPSFTNNGKPNLVETLLMWALGVDVEMMTLERTHWFRSESTHFSKYGDSLYAHNTNVWSFDSNK